MEGTRKACPPQPRPPLVRRGDPAGPVTHHALPVGPIDAFGQERPQTNRMRQHLAQTCFPHVFLFLPPGACTWRPLPAGRKYCVKEHRATALVPGPYPHPEQLLPLNASWLHLTLQVTGTMAHSLLPTSVFFVIYVTSSACSSNLLPTTGHCLTRPIDSPPNQNLVLLSLGPSFSKTVLPLYMSKIRNANIRYGSPLKHHSMLHCSPQPTPSENHVGKMISHLLP